MSITRIVLLSTLGIAALAGGGLIAEMQDRSQPGELSERCEKMILGNIASPSTYRRIDAGTEGNDVIIHFDAQNENGATTRRMATCRFDDGKLRFALIGDNIIRESLLTSY